MPHARQRRFFSLDQFQSPWPMLLALVASIPAFYDSLMPTPASWAAAMYVVSGALVLAFAWRQMRHARRNLSAPHAGSETRTRTRWRLGARVDWPLGTALLLCAALPPSSQSASALGWRMAVAFATLVRLVLISKPLFERAGLARLLGMAAAVLGLCGIGFYWIDPEVTSLSSGLWLAFSTAATVGYGDVVPSNTASRIFSVFVVLLGYGILSLVTASVAAMFVGSQERKVERDILRDMHQQIKSVTQEIAALRQSIEEMKQAQQTDTTAKSPPSSAEPRI